MLILSLESSTSSCSVALARASGSGFRILSSCEHDLSSSPLPAEQLLGRLRECAERAGYSLRAVDAFAVGLWPSSAPLFAKGLMLVKGLALANGKPLIPVSSLEAMARSVSATLPTGTLLLPALGDTRVCAGLFRVQRGGRLARLEREREATPGELEAWIEAAGPAYGFGEGYAAQRPALSAFLPELALAPRTAHAIQIAQVAALAAGTALARPKEILSLTASSAPYSNDPVTHATYH